MIFHPLEPTQIRKIVDLQIERLRKQLEEKGIELEVTDAALDAIATQGYDPTYGARPLKRVIQQRIQNPLAVELLKQEFPEGSRVKIDYRGRRVHVRAGHEPGDYEGQGAAWLKYKFTKYKNHEAELLPGNR